MKFSENLFWVDLLGKTKGAIKTNPINSIVENLYKFIRVDINL